MRQESLFENTKEAPTWSISLQNTQSSRHALWSSYENVGSVVKVRFSTAPVDSLSFSFWAPILPFLECLSFRTSVCKKET